MAGQSEAEVAAKTTTEGRSPGPPQAAGRGFCSVVGLALAGYVLKFYCSVNRLPIQPVTEI